jgi:hypothetical protein
MAPEVRQNLDPDSPHYGAVAVRGDNGWGVMHPKHGGHWGTDADVDGWPVLTPAAAES